MEQEVKQETGTGKGAGGKQADGKAHSGEGIVKAICISDVRGIEKHSIPEAHFLVDFGIEGDAHAGHWHRQVSLLSYDKVLAFNERGANVDDGAFGENLVVEGIDFRALPVGTRLYAGTVQLEMTQIGKECHSHCTIYQRMGECIMPREGVFAKVVKEGIIRPGDKMRVEEPAADRPFTAAVITLSDKGAKGERKDESGPAAAQMLTEAGYDVVETLILPDEPSLLKVQLIRLADSRQVDLVLTSGGTGFSMRDQTPEATMAVADRNAPGIAEAIRYKSMQVTDRAMLSRGASVIRKKTLIVNLPGSPKAVKESLGFILDSLDHGLKILRGSASECARR
ncbi:MAG: molybdopterin-binding protein [Lachnospiraceae bacterium]|nr:molybdopterin-binding protein [Lachnospiraceae bacterium]